MEKKTSHMEKKLQAVIILLLISSPFLFPLSINTVYSQVIDTFARNIHLTWQHDTNTTITVNWRTNTEGPSIVQYGLTPFYGLTAYGLNGTFHHVEITGLQPSTVYHYRVINGSYNNWTRDYTFITGNNDDYARFVVWGDSRTMRNDRREVVEEVYYMQPSFSIFSGDMVEEGNKVKEWQNWFADFYPLISISPLMPVLGNHERNNSYYYKMFALPSEKEYYSFNYGSVHFSILDSNVEDYDGSLLEQAQWLKSDLASVSSKYWKVVVLHIPPFDSSYRCYKGEYKDINDTFVPIFENNSVDLVIGSHDHLYERLEKDNITYVISGGAGAPLYSVVDKYMLPESVYIESVHHACIVEATKDSLYFRAYRTDYSLMDSFTLYRGHTADLTISNVETLKQVLVNEETEVPITISNIGNLPTINNTKLTIVSPEGNIINETIPPLEPGKSVSFKYSWIPRELKTYQWSININSSNDTTETIKINNRQTLTFSSVNKITALGTEPNPHLPYVNTEEKSNYGKEIALWISLGVLITIVITVVPIIYYKKIIQKT